MSASSPAACPLCTTDGGLVVARTPRFHVVRVTDEPAFPAFYRLIWATHVAEFSDLADTDRHACMDAVTEIERAMRSLLAPTKVNLASLGNVVPHLHWHVIARFEGDSHFPAPIWADAKRQAVPPRLELAAVDTAIVQRVAAMATR